MVNWAKWDLGLCQLISPGAVEASYELPNGLDPDQPSRGNLEEVPLYVRLRQLAQPCSRPGVMEKL